jgi:hypothetical protein
MPNDAKYKCATQQLMPWNDHADLLKKAAGKLPLQVKENV